jgi:ribonuclease-3
MNNNLSELEAGLGYEFKDKSLLEQALTHSSAIQSQDGKHSECNERLEFLGDGFFDAIIGEELYKQLPDRPEGVLSKDRSLVVCEDGLYEIAMELNLGEYLSLGKSELNSGGRMKESIIADAMEAIIGAVYLDAGYEAARKFVLRLFGDRLKRAMEGSIVGDYKSAFQELVQRNGKVNIKYKVEREDGPDHDKLFYISLLVNGAEKGKGQGKSKKEAEQEAAKAALARYRK